MDPKIKEALKRVAEEVGIIILLHAIRNLERAKKPIRYKEIMQGGRKELTKEEKRSLKSSLDSILSKHASTLTKWNEEIMLVTSLAKMILKRLSWKVI